MEADTILEMIRRIEAAPKLGLLQTLPTVVRAQSIFGRAMQFAAAFYSPVFARGLARLQGTAGPFWGHNAIVRTRAWAAACGLPVVAGDLRGVPDVVRRGESGVLTPVGDAAAFAAAIDSLLADPARRHAMGNTARAFVKQERRIAHAAESLKLHIERVL